MFNPIKHYLIKFAHFLRDRWIKLIARLNKLDSDEIEKRYGRPCLVCLRRFIPRFTHHLLCSECEIIYLKCWNPSCLNYFQPINERRSETFCPICRSKGQAKDLLSELYSQTGDSRFNTQPSILYRIGHPIVSEKKITDAELLDAFE
jgi:hypothetical protein